MVIEDMVKEAMRTVKEKIKESCAEEVEGELTPERAEEVARGLNRVLAEVGVGNSDSLSPLERVRACPCMPAPAKAGGRGRGDIFEGIRHETFGFCAYGGKRSQETPP